MPADQASASRPAILAAQQAQLRSLVEVVRARNEFYRSKLAGTALEPAGITLERFRAFCPFTTKPEIADDQRAHPPFGTNLTEPLRRYTRFHQTSGTSGFPLHWLDTSDSWEAMVGCWVEVFDAAGVTAADRVLFAFSFGPFLGFWLAFDAAQRKGCLCLPGGGMTSKSRLRCLIEYGVTVLCCTPTYAVHLAEVAAQEKIDLTRAQVRRLMVAGEPGGSIPEVRSHLSKLWNGAAVFDHHGMTEVGPVTYECPQRPGVLHVMESSYLAEVIDPATGKEAAPGAAGELVLTTLRRVGSPLLRYRTGDLVRAEFAPADAGARPCACGRFELTLEGGILGRADDMIIVRGVNVYPSAVEAIVRQCAQVLEYQVTVDRSQTMTEMRLEVEIDARSEAGAEAMVARRLEKLFQDALALRVPVRVVGSGELPRFEMKAKRWRVLKTAA